MQTQDDFDGDEWIVLVQVGLSHDVRAVFEEWCFDFEAAPRVPGVPDSLSLAAVFDALSSSPDDQVFVTRRTLARIAMLAWQHTQPAVGIMLESWTEEQNWKDEGRIVWTWIKPFMKADPVLSTMPQLASST